jgi:ABC-type transporter Mla MlaB component
MTEVRRERGSEREVLTISGDATIAGVKELKSVITEAIAASPAVHVVFEHITSVDVTLLQLLCSSCRTAANQNRTLTVESGSCAPVEGLMEQAGFLRHIGCDEKTSRHCLWITQ